MFRASYVCLLAALCAFAAETQAEELFVAVGYGGRRMVSTDGLKWEITAEWAQPGGDDGNNLISAVFAQGKFVVVGGGGGGNSGNGHVLVSTDGRAWKEVYEAKNRISPIVYGKGVGPGGKSGGGRFVAGGTNRKLLWSDDGETWHEGAQIKDNLCTHFRGAAFGNDRFVFVGNHGGGGGPHWVAVSPDGETVSHVRTDLPGHGSITFGAGKFFMLTSHTNADLITSSDGVKWDPIVVAADDKGADAKVRWITWTGNELLAEANRAIYRSTDGAAWTKTELTAPRGTVMWSDGKRFIATSWPGKMSFSAEGKTWTDAAPLTANGINRVVRGEQAR